MKLTTLIKSVIATLLGITFSVSASANLIVNGDFEIIPRGSEIQSWGSVKLFKGEDVDGWNDGASPGTGDNVELWLDKNGTNTFAELNSHDNTAGQSNTGRYWNLSQNFAAFIGQKYLFTFDYRARRNSNEEFKVRIGRAPGDFFETFNDHTTNEWTSSGDKFFVASASNLRLNFFSRHRDGSVGNFIDNVSITAVPEPGSLALLGLGLLGLGLGRRKKGRKKA